MDRAIKNPFFFQINNNAAVPQGGAAAAAFFFNFIFNLIITRGGYVTVAVANFFQFFIAPAKRLWPHCYLAMGTSELLNSITFS